MAHKLTSLIILALLSAGGMNFVSSAADTGSWLSVQLSKKWDGPYAFCRMEHRSFHNFSDTEAWFVAAGGGYGLTQWLNADLSYEYWKVNSAISVHKAVLAVNATLARGGLSATLREKVELSFLPDSSTGWTFRTRLRVQYAFDKVPFRPYVMVEFFNNCAWIRTLHYIGTDIVINRHHSFDLFYMYNLQAVEPSLNIIGAGYYFNF
ncbi:MAG: DUF2490 domain-containing protein [Bacteroidales bacterium]|nr:DUF2490 domain-containing protein [Bacteroidales bacterium]